MNTLSLGREGKNTLSETHGVLSGPGSFLAQNHA